MMESGKTHSHSQANSFSTYKKVTRRDSEVASFLQKDVSILCSINTVKCGWHLKALISCWSFQTEELEQENDFGKGNERMQFLWG